MALIVEDGSGIADANAYADVDFVDDYCASRGIAAWSGDSATKEAAIINATEFLDYSFAWKGEIASETQGRRFPRKCLVDRDGRQIPADGIPPSILAAMAELSVLALSGPLIGGSGGVTSGSKGAIKRVKAEGVEVEYQGVQTHSAPMPQSNSLPDGAAEKIDRILAGLFKPAGGVMISLSKS